MTGRRRLIAPGAAILATLAVPGAADAQAQIATSQECARLSSPAEEIACLRRALDQSQQALSRAPAGKGKAAKAARAAPAAAASRPAPAEQLGAEQVAGGHRSVEREADAGRVQAVVANVTTDPRGLLVLHLDNGQVWQQADASGVPLQLGSRRYAVEIAKSGFGGYRMRFPAIGRQIVVRRMQ